MAHFTFIKNFFTPSGIDFSLLLAYRSNNQFEGDIIIKENNKVIYKQKINDLTLESNIYFDNLKKMKYYILVPIGILKQNTRYTLIGDFQNIPIKNSLYLRFFKSDLGNFFHEFGIDWFRVKL